NTPQVIPVTAPACIVCQTTAPTTVSASPASICVGSSTTLSATCATGTLAWYADAALTSLVSSQVTPTATTTYYGACINGTCKSSATSVVVNVTPAIALTNSNFSKTNPTSCGGSQGTIKICGLVANTNFSVSYNKNGAAQSSNTLLADATGCITLTNLMAGTYDNFIVTNATTSCSSGIVSSASLVLLDPPSAFITLGTTQNPSACGLNDGFIQINGLTAGTPYTVNYMQNGLPQTPVSFSSSSSSYYLSGLTAANYTNITVTSGACTSNPLSKSLSDPITTTITLGAKTNPTTCSGNEGSFTVSGLAPNTAYVLNYSKDGFVQTPIAFTSTSTSYIVSGLLSGSYTNIRVISAGCTSNSISTVLSDPASAVIALGTPNNPTTCSGTDGSLTITGLAPGTVYMIKYKKDGVWQTPITYSATTTSYTIEGLSAGSYTNINVTNNACISNSLSQMLVDPLPPVIGIGTITQPNSCGANNGTVVITGLTTGLNYTLNYLKDGVQQTPVSFKATGTTYTLASLVAGNYTGINVKQSACISNTLNVSLSNPGGAIIEVLGVNPISCSPGNEGKFVITGLAQGLNYILNYSKSGVAQTPISIAALSTSYVVNGLTAAAYTNITVTQANCVSNVVSTTLVSPTLSAAIVASINPICSGTTTTLEATCATGTVKWYTDVNLTSQLTDATVSPIVTTTYYASCEVNGCKSSATPVEIKVNNCISSLKIVKSQTAISGQTVGSKITYSLVVTNTGNTTLTNVEVKDANATLIGINSIASLVPNATVTLSAEHVLTQADLDAGKVINVANVSGKSPNGSTVSAVSDAGTDTSGKPITNPELVDGPDADTDPTNDPTETTLTPLSSIKIVKSQTVISGQTVGSKITYSLVVTNTGSTTLTNVVVTDANATLSGINPIASLAPNATATLSAEHTLTQADLNAGKVINVANVSGKNPNGSTVSAVSDAGTDTNGKPITNPELVDGPDADTDPTNDPTETTLCSAPVASVNGGMTSVIICSGGTATLSATGCSGTIAWTSNSGDIVPANGIVSPKVTTTYMATCTNGSCVSLASNSVTVTLGPCANPDGIISIVADTKSIIPILANDKNSDGTQADLAKITVPVVTTDPSKGTTIVNPDGTISYTPNPGASGTDTFIYTICDKANPSVCDTAKVTILINAVLDVKLQLKVFLQGAFFSPSGATDALMRDDLRTLGVIPTVEPYTGMANSRFTKVSDNGGQQIGTGVLTTTGSNAIVDWVFVELRDAANPSTILKTRAALVQRDGDVVEASDGTTPVTFIGAVGTSYYVSIKHRNHLGAMTATPITMSATGTTVDFTSMTAAQLWDKGLVLADGTLGSYDGSEQVTLGNGKMGLWAGNARNADNKVKYSGTSPDPAVILSQVITFSGNTAQSYNYDFVTPVYLTGDINMDGKVKYQGSSTDTAFILFNIINKYPNNLTNKAYNFDFMVEQIP
ncbi:Ig-like domain-containing protein, partial [Emticicia sp. W12TSBA100-4]|uniref:beta strand repeat-containing protein n=1 Tax=Emticicia sp. W12TSBA100-4 TaxID=3160965 RepID=UPI0033066260